MLCPSTLMLHLSTPMLCPVTPILQSSIPMFCPLCPALQAHERAACINAFHHFVLFVPFVASFVMSSVGTADTPGQALGIEELIQEIVKCVPLQPPSPSGPFKFAIDHCFAIRGQGTILTGTALSGAARVGDSLELPELKVSCQKAWCSCCPQVHTRAYGFVVGQRNCI